MSVGTLVPCPKELAPPALKADQLEIMGQVRISDPGWEASRGSVASLSSDHSPKMPGPDQAQGAGGPSDTQGTFRAPQLHATIPPAL